MKKIILGLILLVCLVGCSTAEGEGGAKAAAENYMDLVKEGNMDAEDYLLDYDIEGFIDLFDYKYLDTIEESEEKDTYEATWDLYESAYTDEFDSFEDFKDERKGIYEELYGEDLQILNDDSYSLEVWDGESYKTIYTLLYNVEIANAAGEKIYKKAEITLEPGEIFNSEKDDFEESYVITDIYLR